ncbi:pre-rRNA-processing protein esf2 [Acyrthosiphon pisum]|uniref:Activator of basal transcription 1 n=2 Tax=Acyrthosiphon pisum TaxID=7029 RepID=A0A8R1W1E7_ACYPI|nr:pre-rRNA-processing protein esf2 [Acyrthosiphon pisum]|eukprot:XP_001948686.1 PREDICTED: pre-rRNA-processing protein esf2 [Acyrthosiphon pisum]
MSDCESLVSFDSAPRIRKKGIVYLSSIPKYMNVTKLRELLGQYGEIGRVFLQPASNPNLKKRPAKHFTEGWIEFERKKVAKMVAEILNGKRIDSRKSSKYFDSVWNLKYLPRFKWVHLNERLAYEKAVRKHRLRAEVSQVKREANHFSSNIVRSEKNKLYQQSNVNFNVQQRLPEEEFLQNKNCVPDMESRTDFLSKLFDS